MGRKLLLLEYFPFSLAGFVVFSAQPPVFFIILVLGYTLYRCSTSPERIKWRKDNETILVSPRPLFLLLGFLSGGLLGTVITLPNIPGLVLLACSTCLSKFVFDNCHGQS